MPELNQDLSDVTEEDMAAGGWKALPDGEYRMAIQKSKYERTNAGDGMCLKLEVHSLEPTGPSRGAKLFENLTLEHPKAEVVRIAKATLKEIAIATGHPDPNFVRASEELHSRPMLVKVRRVPEQNQKWADSEGFKNEVMAYRPISEHAPTAPPTRTDEAPHPAERSQAGGGW